MKKKILICVLGLLCLNFSGQAATQPLKIGDQLPDIPLENLINAPSAAIHTSAYRGKLLILDFWATWCSSCIAKFPEAEKLQRRYPDQLQILGVAYETREKIDKFFRSPAGKDYHFTSVTADTQLSQLFPHRTIPHYIWINPQGKIIAITGSEEFTSANIISALQNSNSTTLQVKKDLNTERPLFLSDDYTSAQPPAAYTLLSEGYYSGLPSGAHFRRNNNILYGRALTNATLLQLFEDAAYFLFEQQKDQYTTKRRSIAISDTAAANYLKTSVWNFEFIRPPQRADSLWQDMLAELNRLSAYTARIEKRPAPCYILRRLPGSAAPLAKGGQTENTLFDHTPARLMNSPIAYLLSRLDALPFLESPLTDETGITGPVDLVFPEKPRSVAGLNQQLKAQGLELIRAERPLNQFIITRKP